MKSVQIDQCVENDISKSSTPTGLLIGQCWDATKPYIFHSIPTPPLPPSVSPVDWFLTHVRTTCRSLCGGLDVVGMYVNGADEYKKMEQRGDIKQMIFGLPVTNSATGLFASSSSSSSFSSSSSSVDRYLFRYPSSMECYTSVENKPKSVQFKFTKLKQDSMVEYRTQLHVQFDIPIKTVTNSSSLSSQIQSHFDTYCSYLLRHVAHNDDDNQVIEKAQSGSSSNKGRKGGKGRKEESNEERAPEYVEFFAPPYLPPVVDATEGVVHIDGVIHGRAYAHKKQTIGQAVHALKVDLANSLQHRLSVLIEDEIDVNGAFNLPMMPFFAWGLPRRVFLNIGDICACDYLLSHELEKDACDRVGELLSISLSNDDVDAIETTGEQEAQTNTNVVHPQQQEMKKEYDTAKKFSNDAQKSSTLGPLVAAVGALALAVTAGWATDLF